VPPDPALPEKDYAPQEPAVRSPISARPGLVAARTGASAADPSLVADELAGTEWLPLWRNGDPIDRPHWLLLAPLRRRLAMADRLVLAGAAAIVVLFWVLVAWLVLQLV